MNEYLKEREIQRKREYYRNWRARNPEKVKAAQERYWRRRLAEVKDKNPAIPEDTEIR